MTDYSCEEKSNEEVFTQLSVPNSKTRNQMAVDDRTADTAPHTN